MEWQATDQFGNLFIGESDAESVEELEPHVAQLVAALHERAGETFRIHLDWGYREICGPDPDSVSHVLRVPWLGRADRGEVVPLIGRMVGAACEAQGLGSVTFTSE
ncbi:MAG: hypothetical protein JST30_14105 [Armatimonadetes bacterium]|nr:hypothetical protein [Armatimonadota bacterium]